MIFAYKQALRCLVETTPSLKQVKIIIETKPTPYTATIAVGPYDFRKASYNMAAEEKAQQK